MKLILLGDTHFTTRQPKYRNDDYFAASINKFCQVLELAKFNEAIVLQAGDFFDNHAAPEKLKVVLLRLLFDIKAEVVAVHGQHDLEYHSQNLSNTSLGVMAAAGAVTVPGFSTPDPYYQLPGFNENVRVYNGGWGSTIPAVPPIHQDGIYKILILHRLIVPERHTNKFGGECYFFEDEVESVNVFRTSSGNLVDLSNYNLLLTGDNHTHFIRSDEIGNHLINPGPLLRSSIDKVDYEPCVVIFDTFKLNYEIVKLEVQPAEQVFDFAKLEFDKKIKEVVGTAAAGFVDDLKSGEFTGINFQNYLLGKLKTTNFSERTKEFVLKIIREAVSGDN